MDESSTQLVELLGRNFIQRKDVKAWQHDDGSWTPERKPMKMSDFAAHLDGTKTMGHYMVDQEDECKLFAFDIDIVDGKRFIGPHEDEVHGKCEKNGTHIHPFYVDGEPVHLRKEWLNPDSPHRERLTLQLRCMAEGLALRTNRIFDIPVAICNSGGKGLHVYGLTGSLPAAKVRAMAQDILTGFGVFVRSRGENFWRHESEYKALEIEVFPKQDSLDGKDLGNLMKLPLGVNRKSGIRSEFVSCRNGYNQPFMTMDAVDALRGDLPWE